MDIESNKMIADVFWWKTGPGNLCNGIAAGRHKSDFLQMLLLDIGRISLLK